MKAAYIEHYGQEKLTLGQLPKLKITSAKQVLVKVLKASVNPVDLKIQSGKLRPLLHFSMPLIWVMIMWELLKILGQMLNQ